MDAADDESIQPIKILLVVALPRPLVIEMSACLLLPAHHIWALGEHGEYPEGADQLRTVVGKCSQLRRSMLFRMTVLCTPEKLRL